MPPLTIPSEFEDLLSRAGRRVLAGTHPLCGALADPRRRFLCADDLLDRAKVARVRRALDTELAEVLEPLDRPVPPESISAATITTHAMPRLRRSPTKMCGRLCGNITRQK